LDIAVHDCHLDFGKPVTNYWSLFLSLLEQEVFEFREDKMGTLIFVCPTTGLEVVTGLEMDEGTFQGLPGVLPDIRCPHCPEPHRLSEVLARLVRGNSGSDKAA
jgi:hypothetical protein